MHLFILTRSSDNTYLHWCLKDEWLGSLQGEFPPLPPAIQIQLMWSPPSVTVTNDTQGNIYWQYSTWTSCMAACLISVKFSDININCPRVWCFFIIMFQRSSLCPAFICLHSLMSVVSCSSPIPSLLLLLTTLRHRCQTDSSLLSWSKLENWHCPLKWQ